MAIVTAQKDPDAVLDYSLDWSAWLDGDTIVSSTWTISGPDTSLTIDEDSETTTVTTVWLSAGTRTKSYNATNHITTASVPARQDDRTIRLHIVAR